MPTSEELRAYYERAQKIERERGDHRTADALQADIDRHTPPTR